MAPTTECPVCRTPIAYGNKKQCSGCGMKFFTSEEQAAANTQVLFMPGTPVAFGHPEEETVVPSKPIQPPVKNRR